MATLQVKVEALVNKAQDLGEQGNVEEAFAVLPKPLTPVRAARLQAGKRPHIKRMTGADIDMLDAMEDWEIALELGEL